MDGGWAEWSGGCPDSCTHTRGRTYTPPLHGGLEGEGEEEGEQEEEECCVGNSGDSNPIGVGWKTIYNKAEEQLLVKGSNLGTLCVLGKEWRVTHDFKPTEYLDGFANSLHLTIGGNREHYGDRTPDIWPSTTAYTPEKMQISSAVNGNKDSINRPAQPPVGAWTTITISQTLEGGKYFYRIMIGDQEVHAVENSQPEEFQGVKVYASNPWVEAQPGSIRNLVIETRVQVEEEGEEQREEEEQEREREEEYEVLGTY